MLYKTAIATLASLALTANAQDPAEGWMAYAVGVVPQSVDRITKLEMQWKVSNDPKESSAFFSPWFGMDPEDNLNLIQPVNPWGGGQWSMYTEYFQWQPVHNSNSRQEPVKAGQTLHGFLEYNKLFDGYNLTQTVVETGAKSYQFVKCQSGKKYTLPYVVYEKVFPCGDYPSDGIVKFTDIAVECDGVDCTKDVRWNPMVKDPNCNFQANIIDAETISITWDTSMASKYDNMTRAALHDLNNHGWAAKLNIERPTDDKVEV